MIYYIHSRRGSEKMNCPNCGTNVNSGENFCRACGTSLVTNVFANANIQQQNNMMYNNQSNMVNNNYQQNSVMNNNQSNIVNNYSEEELVNAYIGNNANKIKSGKFSWCVFFFGFFYTLYRKMWLLSLIWYLTAFIIIIFLPSLSVLTYVVNFVICFKFNEIYLKNAKENVNKIKANNLGKNFQELRGICEQKGGTSLAAVVIAILIYVLLLSA